MLSHQIESKSLSVFGSTESITDIYASFTGKADDPEASPTFADYVSAVNEVRSYVEDISDAIEATSQAISDMNEAQLAKAKILFGETPENKMVSYALSYGSEDLRRVLGI